jgi:hypothetical protein
MNTECMTFDDVGSVTKYVYSAAGQKLRVVHYTAKPNISRTWGVKPAESWGQVFDSSYNK